MVVVKIGADDSEGGRVWQNHVQTHAQAYPRKKTRVSENKTKERKQKQSKMDVIKRHKELEKALESP